MLRRRGADLERFLELAPDDESARAVRERLRLPRACATLHCAARLPSAAGAAPASAAGRRRSSRDELFLAARAPV